MNSTKVIVLFFVTYFSLEMVLVTAIFKVTVPSKQFKTISSAVMAAPSKSNTRSYIRIKPGTYKERIRIPADKTYITLIGEDARKTIIVSNRSNKTGFHTYNTSTLSVKGIGFMSQSITFENSAGAQGGQAVAVLDEGEQSVYYKCVFLGFQDTLYANGRFQFYKECNIYGSVDFIFGKGLVVFQDCNIFARLPNSTITVTAQSKTERADGSGYSFQNCNVTVAPEIITQKENVKVFLGRPWRSYSTVIFMQSFLDSVVDPRGWLEWSGTRTDLLFYVEFENFGLGAKTSSRVKWPGYRRIKDRREAAAFTVKKFINGTFWLYKTGVPFRPSLYV